MPEGIHANIGAIQTMEAACDRFARMVADRLPDMERELRQVSDALDDRRDELCRKISNLQDEISAADGDEDTSWARSQVEDAEEDLASVQRRRRRLSEVGTDFTAHARKAGHLATDHAGRTREFLRGTVDDLKAYLALDAGGVPGNAPNAGSAPMLPGDSLVGASPENTPDHILTTEQEAALHKYTNMDYLPINQALREASTDSKVLYEADQLSQALARLPGFCGPVHRGVYLSQDQSGKYIPGAIIQESAFISTSFMAESALAGNTIFTIRSKTGRSISPYSQYPEESEILFDRGTRFRVLNREISNGITRVEMEEL